MILLQTAHVVTHHKLNLTGRRATPTPLHLRRYKLEAPRQPNPGSPHQEQSGGGLSSSRWSWSACIRTLRPCLGHSLVLRNGIGLCFVFRPSLFFVFVKIFFELITSLCLLKGPTYISQFYQFPWCFSLLLNSPELAQCYYAVLCCAVLAH